MAISYVLAPMPKWIIIGNDGLTAGGAKLYTRSSTNPDDNKPVYQDSAGTIPYTNPIVFDANGVQGPFYWKIDTSTPTDGYYLRATDSDDNLLWTVSSYFPSSSGSGGSSTTYLSLVNLIANNAFIDHIADVSPAANVTNTVIAPSNHHGFTPDVTSIIGTYGALGPDIRFIKNNTGLSQDTITFQNFTLGSADLLTGVTPVQYIRYVSTATGGSGESFKAFQFPICQKVNNLSGQAMTFQFWAKVAATPVTVELFSRQYYSSASTATAESITTRQSVGTKTLSTGWTLHQIQFTMPSVGGNTIGAPTTNDDAVYLQLGMPLNASCDVWFTLPEFYLGTVSPLLDFTTYDVVDSITQTPRTGDIRTSARNSIPGGWIAMNDGSIGNASSGGTTRANADCFQLFKTLWDSISNSYAPTQDSAGTPAARGATALADFEANRRIVLTRAAGRALGGYGAGSGLTSRGLGEYLGTQDAVVISHTHTVSQQIYPTLSGAANSIHAGQGQLVGTALSNINISTEGVSGTELNMQPTTFYNVFIKL